MTETSTPAKSPAKSEKTAGPKENTSVDSERQKDVTKDYRNNWSKIFGRK